jgi:DNA polymerase I-like protein with 3'-5' exonuclease and polymerase domains
VKVENSAKGRVDAPILVVQDYPLSDRMTNWFWRNLINAGIQKTDVRLVYMLDEAPVGAHNKPTQGQIKAAEERFEREVLASTAKVVVPMGSAALYALTGIKENIFESRGFIIRKDLFRPMPKKVRKVVGQYKRASKATGAKAGDDRWGNVTVEGTGILGLDWDGIVIPTFSCDYIRMEQFTPKPAFKEDMRRAARAATGNLHEIGTDMTYWISQHERRVPDGAMELTKLSFESALAHDFIAVDIETHGIGSDVVSTVQFSDGDHTGCFPWTDEVRQMTERIFARPNALFIVHNSTFDIPLLQLNGVYIAQEVIDRRLYCSMFGAVVIQPDLHKGLGRCASIYLDVTPWKWDSLKDAKPELYAAKDALVTNWLGRIEIHTMKSLGMWNLFMGVDGHPGPGVMETLPELELMTRGGLLLDQAGAQKWVHKLDRQLLRYTKLWTRMFPETNPHANPQVQKLLYGTWGLPVQRNRHSEGISVDELALITLSAFVRDQRKNPAFDGEWQDDPRCVSRTFDLLLKIRNVSKTISTYVMPVASSEEARVHPRYIPVSKDDDRGGMKMDNRGNTATGRLASYGPNIQNQPKICRALYVPDQPDWCFIQADYKSAELYVLAGMSGDARLLADLAGDMHQLNADRLGIDRKPAKNVTYASQYLASPPKQSEMILEQAHIYVSPAECARISASIWGNYAEAQAYKMHLVHLCDTQHKIINPFGRVRYFHDGRATAAVNFIPQSTVADILWCVLKPVAEVARMHGGRMVTTVHDSILVAVPRAEVAHAARRIKEVMEQRFDNVRPGFFIPVELEVAGPGEPWSAVKPYKLSEAA